MPQRKRISGRLDRSSRAHKCGAIRSGSKPLAPSAHVEITFQRDLLEIGHQHVDPQVPAAGER